MHGRSLNKALRPSHLYNVGKERVRFSPSRQALLAQRAECREMLGEVRGVGAASSLLRAGRDGGERRRHT